MKRILSVFGVVSIMVLTASLIVACSKDDDNGKAEEPNQVKPDSTDINIPVGDSVNLVFYQSDGIIRYISNQDVDSMSYADNGNLQVYYLKDNRVVSYSIHMLDSVGHGIPAGVTASAFPETSDFMEAIDNATAPDSIINKVEPSAPRDETASDYSDYIENFTVKNTIVFKWSGNTVEVSGSAKGVTVTKNNGHVTVQSTKGKMQYVLEGSTTDGSFKVETLADDDNKKFALSLNGVEITNPNGPAINIQSGKTVLVNLRPGKVNTLKDGEIYTQSGTESPKGTFFSEGQLIFSGAGTLNVTSLGGHGICSDDYIRLRNNTGEINITSAKDGFNTKDIFLMYGGKVKINSSRDGISVRRGPFELYAGTLDITSADDGIVSDDSLLASVKIGGGRINVATTDPKGHAITTKGNLVIDKGSFTASTQGAASKCITAVGDITITDSYINLSTQGNPQYDEDEDDWSSAACLRSKSGLSVSGSNLFLLSSGQGSKCINAAAGVNLETSSLTLATKGPDYEGDNNNVRSRAIDAVSLTVGDGSVLQISAAVTAVYVESKFDVKGGNVFAYSLSDAIKAVNVKGSYSQTGGLITSGLSK